MKEDYLKISADLRRIAYWLYEGNEALAINFLTQLKTMYPMLDKKIWNEVEKIKNKEEDILKRSERALTLSAIYGSN